MWSIEILLWSFVMAYRDELVLHDRAIEARDVRDPMAEKRSWSEEVDLASFLHVRCSCMIRAKIRRPGEFFDSDWA